MKLKQIAANVTELTINDTNVMFSYETPVAGWNDNGAFRTNEKFSVTTTKHINKYLAGLGVIKANYVTQKWIESIVN